MKMAYQSCMCVFIIAFACLTNVAFALFIDGCPIFGCRPSGSFSFYSKIPRNNASINWMSSSSFNPLPNPLGCVADSVNIVCLNNGLFSDEKGYISLYGENGTERWHDKILNYPTLPLLDNYGDVTGSDGYNLVHYDQDGKTYPIIKCYGLRPMFNMQLVSTMYLLLVGEQGGLVIRDTNAIPVAEIFLNGTIQNTNGTFLPISQPVVNGSRFYLLTEFVPEYETIDPTVLNLQRLYAIDVNDRPADIMTIAWSYNFEMELVKSRSRDNYGQNMNDDFLKVSRRDYIDGLMSDINSKQNVLWDASRNSVYVALPPPYMSSSNSQNTFWGIYDKGNDCQKYISSDIDVSHMMTFEADTYDEINLKKDLNADDSVDVGLWVTTSDSLIHAIDLHGNISKTVNLNDLFKTDVSLSSKVALVRENDTSDYYFVFGLKVAYPTEGYLELLSQHGAGPMDRNFLVAVETQSATGSVIWMVPTPDNMEIKGQISGSRGADFRRKDQLIFYAEDPGHSAKILSVH